jgi:hypothetical protein
VSITKNLGVKPDQLINNAKAILHQSRDRERSLGEWLAWIFGLHEYNRKQSVWAIMDV